MPQTHSEKKPRLLKIALVGNPNSGKTTIFNQLTGFRQRVGNYPGVTVEKKEGEIYYNGQPLLLIDLPGIYSLTAYSMEELVTRKVLLEERPDVVVDIVDATNLERSLYLATQLMELGLPLVLALNMSDEARARGIQFDLRKLSALLGVRIVPTVGHKREGIGELLEAVLEAAGSPESNGRVSIQYGPDIESELKILEKLALEDGLNRAGRYNARWLAVKLLESDQDIVERVADDRLLPAAHQASQRLQRLLGERPAVILADRRYGFISGACQEAVSTTSEARHSMSDRLDEVIMNDALGIPVLLVMMYAVFQFTFTLGEPPMRFIEWLFGRLGDLISGLWPAGAESPLESLLVDGIIGGVGGVVVFLPNILLLFLAIALLEDTGYMARAAFIMDRLMHKIGLHGKSFIPLLIGFGCSIPAIMATRTLESRRDRLVTMLITPLMSCGARFPIYALIIPAFFPQSWQAPVLWLIYVTGIALAILMAKLLGKTVLKGSSDPFVMELPPYRIPTLKSVLIHMWERGRQYLKKAGTIILGISIVLWALTAFPKKENPEADFTVELSRAGAAYTAGIAELGGRLGLSPEGVRELTSALESGQTGAGGEILQPGEKARIDDFLKELAMAGKAGDANAGGRPGEPKELSSAVSFYRESVKEPYAASLSHVETLEAGEQLSYSVAGRLGKGLAALLKPLGFDWKVSTALIGAFAAKEVFVAQLGIIYSVEDSQSNVQTLRGRLRRDYSPLAAVCILLFCLIGTPCMATLAVTRRESGSWGWALLQWGGLTALAYLVTLTIYQAGILFGIGVS